MFSGEKVLQHYAQQSIICRIKAKTWTFESTQRVWNPSFTIYLLYGFEKITISLLTSYCYLKSQIITSTTLSCYNYCVKDFAVCIHVMKLYINASMIDPLKHAPIVSRNDTIFSYIQINPVSSFWFFLQASEILIYATILIKYLFRARIFSKNMH
jgi:hypothetical protein